MDSDSTLEKHTLEICLPNSDSRVGNRFTRSAIPQLVAPSFRAHGHAGGQTGGTWGQMSSII
jgi:hypothetical protein